MFIFLEVWGQTIDDKPGNADPEGLKTSTYSEDIYITVNNTRELKNHLCSAPDFTWGITLKNNPHPSLLLSWKDSQEKHFGSHIEKSFIIL